MVSVGFTLYDSRLSVVLKVLIGVCIGDVVPRVVVIE